MISLPEKINQKSKLDTTGHEPIAQANDNQESEVTTLEPSSNGASIRVSQFVGTAISPPYDNKSMSYTLWLTLNPGETLIPSQLQAV